MSAAATADEAPAKKGNKKLVLIIAIVLALVLVGGGAAAFLIMKKKAAAAAEEDGAEDNSHSAKVETTAKHQDPAHPPTFLPLEPFTVNLADKDVERYAQIGITLQVDDAKFADQMKGFMPAIRSSILMILAHKSSAELLSAEGKETLAKQIMMAAVRPMGIEAEDEHDDDEEPASTSKKKKKKKKPAVHNPVQHVHFSSFIIQ